MRASKITGYREKDGKIVPKTKFIAGQSRSKLEAKAKKEAAKWKAKSKTR